MLSRMDYLKYQSSICCIPSWLNKYLELDIVNRLKGISLLCGMEYASSVPYNFKFYISRYDHSLTTALIVWKLTSDKTKTLAALFHDISSPTFSHVVDYLNNDFINQESTEEYTEEVLNSSDKLKDYLKEDKVSFESVINFKNISVVDLKRPSLCADRLDNTISSAMNWAGIINGTDAVSIINSIELTKNEFDEEEIGFTNYESALSFKKISDYINKLTNAKEDNYMMTLLARILKICIHNYLFSITDLYYKTESEIVEIIENNLSVDSELKELWIEFKTIKKIPDDYVGPKVKDRIVDPLVDGIRLNTISKETYLLKRYVP